MSYVIETSGLSKTFGQVRAVDSVSLRVEQGEIYGFVGLNGAGKTTTIRALLGMIRPSSGSVQLMGQSVGPNGRGPWQRVGYMVERPSAYPELTVMGKPGDRPTIAQNPRQACHFARHRAPGDRSVCAAKSGDAFDGQFAAPGAGARACLHEPELLILDEPASGLDPAGVVEIRELLASLAREKWRDRVYVEPHPDGGGPTCHAHRHHPRGSPVRGARYGKAGRTAVAAPGNPGPRS